jgi:hypothetical protein
VITAIAALIFALLISSGYTTIVPVQKPVQSPNQEIQQKLKHQLRMLNLETIFDNLEYGVYES